MSAKNLLKKKICYLIISKRRLKILIKFFIGLVVYNIFSNGNSILTNVFPIFGKNIDWKDKVALRIISQDNSTFQRGVEKISSILDKMSVTYPSFIWFYTGWWQDLDVSYDINQWKQEILNVHVVPFSHNDPGWLMTYEKYFSSITNRILNIALYKLKENKEMTFVWSEICYLKKWFELISEYDRMDFKRLLDEGRFEILTGGMVMPDEAIVPYYSLLNVLREGHMWLRNELSGYLAVSLAVFLVSDADYSVETAWSIDSFGHSSTYAYFLKKSGVKHTFIQRTHYALKKHLAFRKKIEFYWTHPWDDEVLFTHMSPFLSYAMLYSCGPNIFVCCQFEFIKKRCWDKGDYMKADEITDDNVEKKSLDLVEMLRKKAQFVNHNNVLLMVGDDFSYETIDDWNTQWENMEKIFSYLNSQPSLNVQIRFSTIGKYLRSAENSFNVEIPKIEGDFFPYSDRSNQYWSGFYTTRPKLKSYIRKGQSNLRTAEVMFGLISSEIFNEQNSNSLLSDFHVEIKELQSEFAIYQHHDTITGTSRLKVIEDTSERLEMFLHSIDNLMNNLMSFFLGNFDSQLLNLLTQNSVLLDIKQAKVLQGAQKLILFNSLASSYENILKFYVRSDNVQVIDQDGQQIPCQINSAFSWGVAISEEMYEIHIYVVLKPLSSIEIQILENPKVGELCSKAIIRASFPHEASRLPVLDLKKSFSITNDFVEVHFEGGFMKKVVNKATNKSMEMRIQYMAYTSDLSFNPFTDKSGAYIFLPSRKPFDVSHSVESVILVEGMLKSFVIAKISPEVFQIIELYKGCESKKESIHVTNTIDISKKGNYEISMVLETSLDNDYFFTDLNGYQMEQRKWRRKFGVQGNFYPMTNAAFIEDSMFRVTLLSGQSHAVSGRKRGEIEVMLDRRLLQDDWRGLAEGVTDNVPTTNTFTILLEKFDSDVSDNQEVSKLSTLAFYHSLWLDNPLSAFIHDIESPHNFFIGEAELPCGVHLVSWSVLVKSDTRLEFLITLHYSGLEQSIYDISDFSCFFKTTEVSAAIFGHGFPISEVYEMNLTGSKVKSNITSGILEINQMEIKTWLFVVDLH